MSDRYGGYPPAAGRSATFNPARASMPTSVGYSSMYAGDMHVMPSAHPRHYVTTPRGYSTSTTAAGVPTTTRTYAVTPEGRPRTSTRENSRARRSTLDSTPRPPVIITTTQKDRPHASSARSSNTRAGSPARDESRPGDGQLFYTQPASSIRSRSSARPYHAQDFGRFRDRGDALLSPREIDAYRNSRPSVVYPSDARHSTAAIDYGDDGYQYTNAGELVKYDLDHSKPSRPRRQDSVDRGYYRPNVNYNADQRSFNVNTSHDLSRNYNMNTSRPYEGRAGPPPSTRGFDKINRGHDAPRDLAPAAPIPPLPTITSQVEGPTAAAASSERWGEAGRRSRPLSLHQDGVPRSSHHDEHHRSREDERSMRELLDRAGDTERAHEVPRFRDDSVASRGFGIRADLLEGPGEVRDRRREPRLDEPKRRHDEATPDERRERREGRREDDGDERDRSRLRDKLAAGLGVAATAVGLPAPSAKEGGRKDQDTREPSRRRSPDEGRHQGKEAEGSGRSPGRERDREREREREQERERQRQREREQERERQRQREQEREQERERERDREGPRGESRSGTDAARRNRRESEAKLTGEAAAAVTSSSDSDDGRRGSRRHQPSKAFNPNDASDLMELKEQMAAMDVAEGGREGERDKGVLEEKQPCHSPSPAQERRSSTASREQSRGRELELPAAAAATKQVRVVSPPGEKVEEKPLKGILKQPSARFPEEASTVREGVAPHKEDKKLKEAPPGARWTKINRKIVNREALTIGKERFEVRDDFVIVLRVLSKEEIQAYAAATQVLRERRRNRTEGHRDRGREKDGEQEGEGGRRHHRHHRHRDGEGEGGEEVEGDGEGERQRERERERRRRHRRDDEDDYEPGARDSERHHGRSFRERERERERERAPDLYD